MKSKNLSHTPPVYITPAAFPLSGNIKTVLMKYGVKVTINLRGLSKIREGGKPYGCIATINDSAPIFASENPPSATILLWDTFNEKWSKGTYNGKLNFTEIKDIYYDSPRCIAGRIKKLLDLSQFPIPEWLNEYEYTLVDIDDEEGFGTIRLQKNMKDGSIISTTVYLNEDGDLSESLPLDDGRFEDIINSDGNSEVDFWRQIQNQKQSFDPEKGKLSLFKK